MTDPEKPRHLRRVRSSAIKGVEYDAVHSWLDVQFYHGSVYRYLGVPADLYEELLTAPSKGKFFRAKIKDQYLVIVRGQE